MIIISAKLYILFTLSISLFIIGILGVFITRKNLILILISIELMLLAINLGFIFFSYYIDDLIGIVFSIYVLTIAASEAAIGLALVVIYYRLRGLIAVDLISSIKG